ncbi:MAG: hypothetical protein QM652_02930 [Legionella sp.]|uniref:hypothetical protein n=1 Tax=Legionella sp. TaxID=459 RepID=UPI0039E6698A
MTLKSFEDLPSLVQSELSLKLSNRELANLAITFKKNFSLFKPLYDVRKAHHFLNEVARSAHDSVQSMLTNHFNDLSFIFKRNSVIDGNGRHFEAVSGFGYAVWALNYRLGEMMLKSISENKPHKTLLELMRAQYNQVTEKGITYTLNGKKFTEKWFDASLFLEKLKEFSDQFDSVSPQANELKWKEINRFITQCPRHLLEEFRLIEINYLSKSLCTIRMEEKLSNKRHALAWIKGEIKSDYEDIRRILSPSRILITQIECAIEQCVGSEQVSNIKSMFN